MSKDSWNFLLMFFIIFIIAMALLAPTFMKYGFVALVMVSTGIGMLGTLIIGLFPTKEDRGKQ